MPYTEEVVRHLETQRKIFIVINVVAALCIAVLFILIHNDRSTLAQQAAAIQKERYIAAFDGCVSQNLRHDKTVDTLNKQIVKLPPDRRVRAERTKKFTILLINALAPKKNCTTFATNVVSPKEKG